MNYATGSADVRAASERLFRLYHAQCVSPDRDTLFALLEAGHSLNDRLRAGAELDFFDVPEFTALKCLRNYFHHHQELKHVIRLVPVRNYPIIADLMFMCLVPRDAVRSAIDQTRERNRSDARQACENVFHWYGPVVNINPALFNFTAAAYERLRDNGIGLAGDAVEDFENSYRHEEENGLPHVVDGRLSTTAGSMNDLLAAIMASPGL